MAVTEYFIRYLQSRDALSTVELNFLRSISTTQETYAAGEVIVPEGEAPRRSCMILKGTAARRHHKQNSVSAISALHVPGDFADLHSFTLNQQVGSIVALGDCTVEFIQHTSIDYIVQHLPHLLRLLWLITTVDGQIHRQWLVAKATLRASASIAHIICELYTRLVAVGAAKQMTIPATFAQKDFAGLLGYTPIHINRGVRELRASGLITWDRDAIRLIDWPGLARLAQFDPAYLDLRKVAR